MNDNVLKVNIQMGIQKPVKDVFEAIVDPEKMNKYFITSGTGRMESGKTLIWTWEDYDVEHRVKIGKIEIDKLISFTWDGSGVECLVVITLEPKGDNITLVKITESDWPVDYKGASECMGQVEGWTHFLCCLKAFIEYGVNLRVGGVIK